MNMMWPPAPSDCGAVVKAAEALGIGEYDFFRLAFRRWSGHEPDGKALEQAFVAYMFHQRVPPCVRHLSREVLQLKGSGTLRPGAFGVAAFERRQPLPRLGRFSWRLPGARDLPPALVFLEPLAKFPLILMAEKDDRLTSGETA